MRLHYFQHVPFENLAEIAVWAEGRGAKISCTRLFDGELPPAPNTYDLLAVMGGPMNIYEEEQYPWLTIEKQAIRAAIDGGKKVLGVCLGAQLISDVLGGPVSRNPEPEIGWFPLVRTSAAAEAGPLRNLPHTFTAFHWHGDTFAIPRGTTPLAFSDACPNQAFAAGDQVLALQFHLEASAESVRNLASHCANELRKAKFIQTEAEILAGIDTHLPEMHGHMRQMLDDFVDA